MAIYRKHKVDNFTTLDNNIFKNKNLTYKATGLLCTMLSLPDNWEFSIEGLATLKKESVSAIRTAIQELEANGYLTRTRCRNEKGILSNMIYDIYEIPILENLTLEKPILEKPTLENQRQLNTNISNTNQLNTKELIDDDDRENIFDFIETNFNRTLSPIELEVIKTWEDNDLTRYAIKRAVLNGIYKINYIDKILYNYSKQNITSVQQAQESDTEYQNNKATHQHKETFSEKLDRWAREAEEREKLESEEN